MQNCQIPEFWRPLYVPEFDPPALFMLQPKIQKSSSRLFLGLLKGFQQFGSFRLIFCLQYNFLNVLCLLTYTFLSTVFCLIIEVSIILEVPIGLLSLDWQLF